VVRLRLKPRDAWWTVLVVDPLAGPLTRAVVRRTWVTPNRLTLVSTLIGIGAAAAFALDELIVGALLFQIAFVLDCMDGKLAALRATSNAWGGYLDVAADTVKFAACATALGYVTVAHHGHASAGAFAVLLLFLGTRSGVLLLDLARPVPAGGRPAPMLVEATAGAILAAAPRRLGKIGSTVDTETLVFTIAPIAGLPYEGFVVAACLASLNLCWAIAKGVATAERDGQAPAAEGVQ
jgi:phosphatidylglycerophosphate synthase